MSELTFKNHPQYDGPRPIEERLANPVRGAQMRMYAARLDHPWAQRFKWAMEQSGTGRFHCIAGHSDICFDFSDPCPSVETVIGNLLKSGLHIYRFTSNDCWPKSSGEFIIWEKSSLIIQVHAPLGEDRKPIGPELDLLR